MRVQSGMPFLRSVVQEILMRRADIGIRIRADEKFARLVDKAAEGLTRRTRLERRRLDDEMPALRNGI